MIIAVANLKGGCAKTTTAIALASAIVAGGKEAIVLDADQQASATQWAIEADAFGGLPFEVDSVNGANLSRKAQKASGSADVWAIIDCPPNGDIIDKAAAIADMVLIPTGTGVADMSKTMAVVEVMEHSETPYSVLITQARAKTVSLAEAQAELAEADASCFNAFIRQKEDLRNYFGNPFGTDLYGYEDVYEEIKEALL